MPIPSVPQFRAYIGDQVTDSAVLQGHLDAARDLVDKFVGQNQVPDPVMDQAYLETASKLSARRIATPAAYGGITENGAGIPAPLDPMITTYPLLRRWVPAF
ncbi:hypothetical protein ACFSYH_05895 [Populibacterium corticicola]|uniref:Uncharacterized protein n=1 Tax=Populibacterium corticicola TaxID=1812826 RepID=A0ABW5XFQ0_9MICO